MSVNYNGAGAYWREIPIVRADGTAPLAADTDQFFVAIEPVAGAWVSVSIANQPDVPRNATFGIVDANSSITGATLEVTGTDSQGRTLMETISTSTAGTQTVVGERAFATITSARYIVSGVVTGGADTVQGGYGDVLGLPLAIGAVSDVKNRRQDANSAVGTISIPTGDHGTWELSGGNAPNGARLYFVDIQSTATS